MKPLDEGCEWWLYLSREEWQAVFSLSKALCDEEIIAGGGLDDLMRKALRWLIDEYGVEFEGLEFDVDGTLVSKSLEYVEERNALTWAVIQRRPPSYKEHMEAAIDWFKAKVPNFPLEMLLECQLRIERHETMARNAAKFMSPKQKEEHEEWLKDEIEQAKKEYQNLAEEVPS